MDMIALFGNPNTGKTSLFNKLTRTYAEVGNWSGVTVEKKTGILRDKSAVLVDLPGAYSLLPLSLDEGVATRYLLEEPPTALINIVDASQLQRNLYLTVQLLEYGRPLVLGLNMTDVADATGLRVNKELLADQLNVPIIPMVARTGSGSKQMLASLREVRRTSNAFQLDYGPTVEAAITDICDLLPNAPVPQLRWAALQCLEGNPVVMEWMTNEVQREQVTARIHRCEEELLGEGHAITPAQHIRSERTAWIADLCTKALDTSKLRPHSLTDRLDALLTHRYLGIPIFLLLMYATFKFTFDWAGTILSDMLDGFFSGTLSTWISELLVHLNASAFTQSLVVDGIVAGVGGVLVFLPQIAILFLIISVIEDSGYMARVTILMDRLMQAVGLNGKSFIPFIIGFGCNVPAIMAARTIEQPRERLITTLLVPFMSCSARLPVYALFAGVFFPTHAASIIMLMYVLGIIVSLILAKIFSKVSILSGEPSLFIVELPPYRVPQALTLFRSTWEKVKGFVRKAGTIILAGSVGIWLLSNFGPQGFGAEMNDSLLATVGGWFAPLLAPLGFGTWQAGASLLTGFMAKEVVVSTMNIIYHVPDMQGLELQVRQAFTPLASFSFMVFILLYVPCLATVAVIRKETLSWRWTAFSVIYPLTVAYIIAVLIYQCGRLLGWG
ncbi:ferrous iron transport protein B [Paenibacillus polymyxa]|uniref:ferrous iron transport protein B n=1 Tax=Paenibacillus polymyxa TaxID=1406 RepID=UPI002AB57A5F|nr:ferrous iron transport protein B [Paenibacillus polymyxa]MDY7993237.1 ferrous iron transport protein B [Paenibacillus polymyxa]MDY8119219.1 ferrous iron transport protein B [Paenibacillus polymyxa]